MPIQRQYLRKASGEMDHTEYTGLLRYQKPSKIQKFHCCLAAFFLLIMILIVITVTSYYESGDGELSSAPLNQTIQQLDQSFLRINPLNLTMKAKSMGCESSLDEVEWSEALRVGRKAIEQRNLRDKSSPTDSEDEVSPSMRYHNAVKTSVYAGEIARGGVGELAAGRFIQSHRKMNNNTQSAIGCYFNGNWAPENSCRRFINYKCKDLKYRTYDGTCNHINNYGASFTPFLRDLPPDYADDWEAPRVAKSGKPLPSARNISLRVHAPSPSSNPSFTVMLAVFGQFIDHDITATALSQGPNGTSISCCQRNETQHPECFPVAVGPGDPFYDVAHFNCIEFIRSAPASQCQIAPRQQFTQVTAFIDGSTVYGSDEKKAVSLREMKSGRMKVFKSPDGRDLLPQSLDLKDGCNRKVENNRGRYCFASGDARANENLHLTTLHLLWVREHNLIAAKLEELNPSWSDEVLYQESRRIVGALLQHITYNEFIPIILGIAETEKYQLIPLKGNLYRNKSQENINPGIANSFAAAAFRFAHTLLPGLMKISSRNNTEEYVQLHRMLFNPYSLYSECGIEQSIRSATSNFIQKTSTHVTSELTKHMFQDPEGQANRVEVPCGLDLVSLNIQRGRDHGLPGYTSWREFCQLSKPGSFDELESIMDSESLQQIRLLYEDVDDIDLYTGALAELNDKEDGLVGPLFTCLIARQFHRTQMGDRFWYEFIDQPYPFTPDQLVQLRQFTLARLICDSSDSIDRIQSQVMRSVNKTNPVKLCKELPAFDLTAWKEYKNI